MMKDEHWQKLVNEIRNSYDIKENYRPGIHTSEEIMSKNLWVIGALLNEIRLELKAIGKRD